MLKLLKPHDRIFLVVASGAAELGRAFVRLQEFYESPSARFCSRYFSLESFKRYYARRWGGGRFTYFRDYQGYNLPGEEVLDWQATFASRETADEIRLLQLLGPLPDRFYLIGARTKDVTTIGHELQHALFHLDPVYRAKVQFVVHMFETAPLRRALRKIMYRDSVLDDEVASYVLFEQPWMRRNRVKLRYEDIMRQRLWDHFSAAQRAWIAPQAVW